MKKILLALFLLISLGLILLFVFNTKKPSTISDSSVLEKTYSVSKEYLSLRHRTDDVLMKAENRSSYEVWNNEMTAIINDWEKFEKETSELDNLSNIMIGEKISLNFISPANAYSKEEISNVFDRAPAGKKIKTLAEFLKVDAKRAFQILKQDQAEVEAAAWNEAGDTFQKLETSAVLIKDGCKVTGFVGGVILSGGTAGFAASGAVSQTVAIVTGADLVLEISDDAAHISLGNNNKVSEIVGDICKITEPLATVLAITTLPEKFATNLEKFDAIMLGLEQFRSSAQEGKIVGISLPSYQGTKTEKIEATVMNKDEVENWLKENGYTDPIETAEDLLDINKGNEEDTEDTDELIENDSIVGMWTGVVENTANINGEKIKQRSDFSIMFNSDGSVGIDTEDLEFSRWEQNGSSIKIYGLSDGQAGYYEFALSNNALNFVKAAGPDSEGEWSETYAGEDFFGGTFMTITLKKQ